MTIDNRVVFGPPFGGKKQVRTEVRYIPIRRVSCLTGARQQLSFGLPLRPSSSHEGRSLGTPSQAELLEDVADVAFDTVLTEGEQR
jgi:hypothetical protein